MRLLAMDVAALLMRPAIVRIENKESIQCGQRTFRIVVVSMADGQDIQCLPVFRILIQYSLQMGNRLIELSLA